MRNVPTHHTTLIVVELVTGDNIGMKLSFILLTIDQALYLSC